jgi:hypothetical protein
MDTDDEQDMGAVTVSLSKCVNCGFRWNPAKDHGEHDCAGILKARYESLRDEHEGLLDELTRAYQARATTVSGVCTCTKDPTIVCRLHPFRYIFQGDDMSVDVPCLRCACHEKRIEELEAKLQKLAREYLTLETENKALMDENKAWRGAAQDVVVLRYTFQPCETAIDALAALLEQKK